MSGTTQAPEEPGELGTRTSRLGVLVGFNGLAQIVPIGVAFALTPLLLRRLGLDGYGIWSLALVILSTLAALDGGVSASLARFFAIHGARDEHAETGRLWLGSLLLFALIGIAATLLAFPFVPALVGLLHIPSRLHGEAVFVLRCLPGLASLGLAADATAAILQGNSQFRALAATTVASSAAFAVAVIVLLTPGSHLRALVLATAVRYIVFAITSFGFAARRVSILRPLLPSRGTRREVWRYSSRMQLSAFTSLVNAELDAIVIAAVLPVRYVGLYGIGMQVASAVRSPPLYAFAPLLTKLTRTFRIDGRAAAAAEFERSERRWLPGVLGYGVVAVAAVGFSVPVWLGHRYVLGGVTAAILLAVYMVHVGLTGMRTCYVRAVGRPGLETRYSLAWTIGNAAITIPFALIAGEVGVVSATAVTGVFASVYFVILCRRHEGLQVTLPGRRWLIWTAAAGVVTVAGELAIVSTHLHGFLAFALTGVPGVAALAMLAAGMRERAALRTAV